MVEPVITDTTEFEIVDRVERVRRTFDSGVTKPLAWRHAQLAAMHRLIAENYEALEKALKQDLGGNTFWIDGIEIETVRAELAELRSHLNKWAAPHSVSTPLLALPASSYVTTQPYGVVLVIAPWNYPVSLVLVPLFTALAAGNTVVVKPSELSVHTSLLLEKLCNQYLDTSAVVWVQGAVAPTTTVLAQKFDFICYTGNGTVARIVHAAATKHLTPLLLELGGKCPAIITPTASVAKSIKRILWGKFSLNMGQTCISPDYIAVTPANKAEVLDRIRVTMNEFYPNPETCPDVSRIINVRHTKRLAALLNDPSIRVIEGGKVDIDNKFIAPTVIVATLDSLCMRDEIFGPILPIIEFPTVDAIVAYVNKRDKPLALYLFSESSAEQKIVMTATSSGGACINDIAMHVGNTHLPFGGVGESGMGAYHGESGFRTFSHKRSILSKSGTDPSLRFPPYTPSKVAWLKRLRSLSLSFVVTLLLVLFILVPALVLGLVFGLRTL